MKNPLPALLQLRRFSIRRLLLQLLGLMLGLQGIIILILQIISVQRKRHQPQGSFPHQHLGEVQLGENKVQLFDYGHDLYNAMLAAIDCAKESIYLETYIWKGDAIGQAFKARPPLTSPGHLPISGTCIIRRTIILRGTIGVASIRSSMYVRPTRCA